MQIVSSYGVEIKKNIPLRSTLDIFRKAVSYLIPVYAEIWEELSEIKIYKNALMRRNIWYMRQKESCQISVLTIIFPKMPSYLRKGGDSTRTWSSVLLSITP